MYKRSEGGDADDIDEGRVSQIATAINLGYRHLDGARSYNTEGELGAAIRRSNLPREEFFVTTKCPVESLNDVRSSFDASLKSLGLEYVDLYLLHGPFVPDEQA